MDFFPASKEIKLLVEDLRVLVRNVNALVVDGRGAAAIVLRAVSVATAEAADKMGPRAD